MSYDKERIEQDRLILLLVKQDFPHMDDSELGNISLHQRRGYLSQVTRFLKLAELFGYSIEKVINENI